MPDASGSVPFDVALRGYDRDQVDAHLASLESEFSGALIERDRLAERVKQLEARVEELHLQPGDEKPADQAASALNGFGARIEKIMRVAGEEAGAVRQEAKEEIDRERAEARKKIAAQQAAAEKDAAAHQQKVQAESTGLLEKARQEAARVRADADAQAAATREEASGHLESVRARAAQAAADFETALAKRRQKAEADHMARTTAAERELAETEKMRADAERRSQDMLAAAQRESAELVAEARAQADRTRRESERELTSLSKRRDAITDQLRNVREMLSTLTGGAVATDPEPAATKDEPTKDQSDAPSPRNGDRSTARR
jgi:DivIVA domain-containing protein